MRGKSARGQAQWGIYLLVLPLIILTFGYGEGEAQKHTSFQTRSLHGLSLHDRAVQATSFQKHSLQTLSPQTPSPQTRSSQTRSSQTRSSQTPSPQMHSSQKRSPQTPSSQKHSLQTRSSQKFPLYHLVVLHTNDTHGHPVKFPYYPGSWEGGLPARAALIEQIRKESKQVNEHVLVLDAGDLNTGRAESNFFKAKPDLEGYNFIGYDAMVLGNHEFDNPREVLKEQMKLAHFPFLSANIKTKSGEYFARPYIIRDFDGFKVAIFGLTARETKFIENPEYVRGLMFEDEVKVAKSLVPKLRKQADVVIGLVHMGIDESFRRGSKKLASQVSGIDLIVDGHSHTKLDEPILVKSTDGSNRQTIIVQAWQWGLVLGRVDLWIQNRQVIDYRFEAIPIRLKAVRKKTVEAQAHHGKFHARAAEAVEAGGPGKAGWPGEAGGAGGAGEAGGAGGTDGAGGAGGTDGAGGKPLTPSPLWERAGVRGFGNLTGGPDGAGGAAKAAGVGSGSGAGEVTRSAVQESTDESQVSGGSQISGGSQVYCVIGRGVNEDIGLRSLLQPYIDKLSSRLSETIGQAEGIFLNRTSREEETALGDMVADSMLWYARNPGVGTGNEAGTRLGGKAWARPDAEPGTRLGGKAGARPDDEPEAGPGGKAGAGPDAGPEARRGKPLSPSPLWERAGVRGFKGIKSGVESEAGAGIEAWARAGVDFAIQNGGGIKSFLPQGQVTRGGIHEILPFDNSVVILALPGYDVQSLFNYMATTIGRGAFPQVSDGLSFTILQGAGKRGKGKLENVLINGKPIDPDRIYRIATNSYLAAGGYGYKVFLKAVDRYDTSMYQSDVLAEYIKYLGGRIRPKVKERITIIESNKTRQSPIKSNKTHQSPQKYQKILRWETFLRNYRIRGLSQNTSCCYPAQAIRETPVLL